MKDKPWIKGVEINVNFTEKINMGDYSNIEPAYGEKLIVDPTFLPDGMTLDDVRKAHIEYVRGKYIEVRHQKLCDFLNYVRGVAQYRIPEGGFK